MFTSESSLKNVSFKNFCEEYFNMIKNIRKVTILTEKLKVINDDKKYCKILFRLPCQILSLEDGEGNLIDFNTYIIDSKLEGMSNLFNFPINIKSTLKFVNISAEKNNFTFSYTEGNFIIKVEIKVYDYPLEDAYLDFSFSLIEKEN